MVLIIDTSVLLNLLNVPGRNQDSAKITADYDQYVEWKVSFIIPMVTIVETGNHVAQNGNGSERRKAAERFCVMVRKSINGIGPFRPCIFPSTQDVLSWLDDFPGLAGANVSAKREKPEGISFGDLNIIKEWERWKGYFPGGNVKIWSLDRSLQGYADTSPEPLRR